MTVARKALIRIWQKVEATFQVVKNNACPLLVLLSKIQMSLFLMIPSLPWTTRRMPLLRKRLKEVTGDATVLIVAQRVGTIMDADQIIVLDHGEIVGRGTHDELMESNEIYREIANSQLDSPSLTEE